MNTSAQIAFAHVARKMSHFLPYQFWTGGGKGREGGERIFPRNALERIIHQACREQELSFWALDLALER